MDYVTSDPETTVETTVGELVRTAPGRARIFECLGIDYCCGGKLSLQQACRQRGFDPATILAVLNACAGPVQATPAVDLEAMSLSGLCTHIERQHHDFLRRELPRLHTMAGKVAEVHGEHEPRLHEVRDVFTRFSDALFAHTHDEEENVFPAIRRFEHGAGAVEAKRLRTDLGRLETEHDHAGAALTRLRELTTNYTPPEWACNTLRALFDGLEHLERETHQHVHKENNVLFPRVLAATSAIGWDNS